MARGEAAPPKKWRLTYQGEVYDERALDIAQAEAIEDFLGMSWLEINPIASARQARGVLAVLHAERTGRARDDIYGELGKMTAEEFLVDVWSRVVDDMPGSYKDGFPYGADGRTFDRYVLFFNRAPFHWPPSVTRKQTLRDLDLIIEAAGSVENGW